MPGYITTALHCFQHPLPDRPENLPHRHTEIRYRAPIQFSPMDDTSHLLDSNIFTCVQHIVGPLIHYGRAVNNTMIFALSYIVAAQTKSTNKTALALNKFLNYAYTHTNATLRYVASDIILHIYSDSSYKSETKSCSRVGGLFTLTSRAADNTRAPNSTPIPNGATYTVSNIMRNVMLSATEAEAVGLFHNVKDSVTLRSKLAKMGHPQPATTIQTYNSNSNGITNENVKQQKSKAMDMRFYWVQDLVQQKNFIVYWRPGEQNLADYFTK